MTDERDRLSNLVEELSVETDQVETRCPGIPITRPLIADMARTTREHCPGCPPPSPSVALDAGSDQPWSVRSALQRLADAADHLLDVHACDAHGYEGVTAARDAARGYLAAPASVAAPLSALQLDRLSQLRTDVKMSIRASVAVDIIDTLLTQQGALQNAGRRLLYSLGEYVRQSMHANREWRDGIEAMEQALRGDPVTITTAATPSVAAPLSEEKQKTLRAARRRADSPRPPRQFAPEIVWGPEVVEAFVAAWGDRNELLDIIDSLLTQQRERDIHPRAKGAAGAALSPDSGFVRCTDCGTLLLASEPQCACSVDEEPADAG